MNTGTTSVLSMILLISGLWLFSKAKSSKLTTSVFSILALCLITLFIVYGVANYFTGNGIDDATVYHLRYGVEGAGFLEYSWLIAITTVMLTFGIFGLSRIVSKQKKSKSSNVTNSFLAFSFLFVSLLLNPACIDIYNLQQHSLISSGKSSQEIPASFYEYYKTPYIEESEKKPKNIVFVYAESLERTYFDETLFPGLITGLRELESRNTHFTNIRQVARTGWTVAGMTASQCGIPLFTSSHGNSMSGMDQFLPSAVCLGDLLSRKGYQLNYMGGASLEFAGKGKLFKTHGFTSVLGRNELLPQLDNEAYKTGWGLFDDSLFDMSYRRFLELSESDKKFGLFMLTLDTHHPNGHPSASCSGTEYEDGSNKILNAVACSDHLITKFVNRISQSPYADETIVVLVSDHLAMRNTAFDQLKKGNRRNLFMIIDPSNNEAKKIESVGSTLDIGATILPVVGYTGEIGFGRDLLNREIPEEEKIFIHSNLWSWKNPVTAFWGFPKIKEKIEIDIDNHVVNIDGRGFEFPVLIELNDELQSTLKFQFNNSPDHKTLVKYRKELRKDQYFLMIDNCSNASQLDKSLGRNGFCFLAGRGKEYSKIERLIESTSYTSDEVKQLLNITASSKE